MSLSGSIVIKTGCTSGIFLSAAMVVSAYTPAFVRALKVYINVSESDSPLAPLRRT